MMLPHKVNVRPIIPALALPLTITLRVLSNHQFRPEDPPGPAMSTWASNQGRVSLVVDEVGPVDDW